MKTYKSYVIMQDRKTSEIIKEILYYLPPKKALLSAVMAYCGGCCDGQIYKSTMVKDRLIYDHPSFDFIIYAQNA